MPEERTWSARTLVRIRDLLMCDEAVVALATFGWFAGGEVDAWSDLDLLIVVGDDALDRFFPAVAWLRSLGQIQALEQSPRPYGGLTRVCLDELRRLDCLVGSVSGLDILARDPSLPFRQGLRLVFSRAPEVDGLAHRQFSRPVAPGIPDEDFERLVNGFWFKAAKTVEKVVRGDLLVAAHLTLGLLSDDLVLAMHLRDRITGTSIHRDEPGDAAFLQRLQTMSVPTTPATILDAIERGAVRFENLAGEWSSAYRPDPAPRLEAVANARPASAGDGE